MTPAEELSMLWDLASLVGPYHVYPDDETGLGSAMDHLVALGLAVGMNVFRCRRIASRVYQITPKGREFLGRTLASTAIDPSRCLACHAPLSTESAAIIHIRKDGHGEFACCSWRCVEAAGKTLAVQSGEPLREG